MVLGYVWKGFPRDRKGCGEKPGRCGFKPKFLSGIGDVEHAVINFSTRELGTLEGCGKTITGISIHKGQANRLYKISANSPCRVESGDILFIGMNRLALR